MTKEGIIIGGPNNWDDQMEFLLGKPLPDEFRGKLGRCFHLHTTVAGVYNALKLMGKSIDEVIYEEDRKILREHENDQG